LLASIPDVDPDADPAGGDVPLLQGDLPSPVDPPSGCRFRTRCPYAQQRCIDEQPEMRAVPGLPSSGDHFVACHFPAFAYPAEAE